MIDRMFSLYIIAGLFASLANGQAAGNAECQGNVEIKTPTQEVELDCRRQARIVRWKVGGIVVVQPGAEKDFWLFREMFWSPVCVNYDSPFLAADRKEAPGSVSLRMEGELSFLGEKPSLFPPDMSQENMKVEKTYIVNERDGSITANYTIRNPGKQEREMSLWLNGRLNRGDTFQLVLPTAQGPAVVDIAGTAKPSDLMYCVAGVPFAPGREPFEKDARRKEHLTDGTFAVLYPDKVALVYSVEYDKLLELYTRTEQPPTLEIIYRPIKLPAGGEWKTSVRIRVLRDATLESLRKTISGG